MGETEGSNLENAHQIEHWYRLALHLLNRFFVVPEVIDGKTHTATVVELNPWVEYEFRVVASNKIGGGEPSLPSEKVRTEEAG